MTQVEEVKFILRILPIWFCSIIFSAIYTQMLTLFIVQGATMDTRVGRYNVPPASISLFDFISVLSWAPIYEWLLVPLARRYSGHERGFTGLQRMGIGLAIVTIAMVAAASVEIQRLKTAKFHNLLDAPDVPVPISIFWCVNQFYRAAGILLRAESGGDPRPGQRAGLDDVRSWQLLELNLGHGRDENHKLRR